MQRSKCICAKQCITAVAMGSDKVNGAGSCVKRRSVSWSKLAPVQPADAFALADGGEECLLSAWIARVRASTHRAAHARLKLLRAKLALLVKQLPVPRDRARLFASSAAPQPVLLQPRSYPVHPPWVHSYHHHVARVSAHPLPVKRSKSSHVKSTLGCRLSLRRPSRICVDPVPARSHSGGDRSRSINGDIRAQRRSSYAPPRS